MIPENRVIIFLKQIWPTVYRIINQGLYLIITGLKNSIRMAYQQIKGQ